MIPAFLRRRDTPERRARALERAVDGLRDAVHDLDKWGFADRPSATKERLQDIGRRIRRVEALGGDVLDVLPFSYEYLAEEALPEVFERYQARGDNHWYTRRRGEEGRED